MKPLSVNPAEPHAPSLEHRLERLCDALHELPDVGRRSTDHLATRILLSVDDIVGRVRALAGLMEESGRDRWDLVDHTTAQMLLRDLAIIVRDLRAVASTVATDCATAESHLANLSQTLSALATEVERFADTGVSATPDGQ